MNGDEQNPDIPSVKQTPGITSLHVGQPYQTGPSGHPLHENDSVLARWQWAASAIALLLILKSLAVYFERSGQSQLPNNLAVGDPQARADSQKIVPMEVPVQLINYEGLKLSIPSSSVREPLGMKWTLGNGSKAFMEVLFDPGGNTTQYAQELQIDLATKYFESDPSFQSISFRPRVGGTLDW
ncbi:MAG: hypothetical protein JNJ45_03330 [Chthonomonas sp.]|nr:hypothetical protein [Chthonomonas sp.]